MPQARMGRLDFVNLKVGQIWKHANSPEDFKIVHEDGITTDLEYVDVDNGKRKIVEKYDMDNEFITLEKDVDERIEV
jgi:hypothetical protein